MGTTWITAPLLNSEGSCDAVLSTTKILPVEAYFFTAESYY
jgi:hypothetical protein